MAENSEVRLPDTSKLVVSSSPHYHDNNSVRKVMLIVMLALLPACISAVYFFGLRALWIIGVTVTSCVVLEALCAKLLNRPLQLRDCSAVLTGLILALNLSVVVPWWVCVIGALLSVGLAKQLYGGLGYNAFNPAIVGRVGLLVAFPTIMTSWVKPGNGKLFYDAASTATPLDRWQLGTLTAEKLSGGDYWGFFLGHMGGCIGETSALALLIGGIALIALRIIRWEIPVAYLGTVAVFTAITHYGFPDQQFASPLFHLLTGGVVLGAFFIATDPVTSPMNLRGAVIFGVGCGLITCVIRVWGNYPEGVSFAILFMNAFVPLIDRATARKPFGYKKPQTAAA